MTTFSDLLRKAHGALNNLRGENNFFAGKDGDIVYSKNNVCIHDSSRQEKEGCESVEHTPGYMTIQCQNDELLGVTLVLHWLPNTTLEKNPTSIRNVSPRSRRTTKDKDEYQKKIKKYNEGDQKITESSEYDESENETNIDDIKNSNPLEERSTSEKDEEFVINEDKSNDELMKASAKLSKSLKLSSERIEEANYANSQMPSINIIPNTPICFEVDNTANSESSATTSVADEASDKENTFESSSCDEESNDEQTKLKKISNSAMVSVLASQQDYFARYEQLYKLSPEQFAQRHNLMLNEETKIEDQSVVTVASNRAMFYQKTPAASLFSVNLGKMRSMRLFFSADDHSSGQLVIANRDSQYKILHFHHGGLDKLAQLLEQWNAIKIKAGNNVSLTLPDRQLLICHPEIKKNEMDTEEGLYTVVGVEFWKSYKNSTGQIVDSFTVRKAIYFASISASMRKEVWSFLLRVYPWETTNEQRDIIRNDLFIGYQNIKKKRLKWMATSDKNAWNDIEHSIMKDVLRTDRKNPFYADDNNPNMEVLKDILLNYAAVHPETGYIQGMSDLLAPLLNIIRDESQTFWCFSGLMEQSLFKFQSKNRLSAMDLHLNYLRELLKLLVPNFYTHLEDLKGDAFELMFTHRWILLCFKREFGNQDVLKIWETCWARYRTAYFHLFICTAIIAIYSDDILTQKLPHDEILLYFSSLAMHMDVNIVLKKARGLFYQFYHLDRLPCSLADIFEQEEIEQWDSHLTERTYECIKIHTNNEPCPFSDQS